MTVITSWIVKYYRNMFATPMNCTSKFSCYVTMISNLFIVIINGFLTNLASITLLKLFFFFGHDQILVKFFFHYFLTVFILFKNCFNKFISSVFISKNNGLTKSIINTKKLVSKTTLNVILIFFWVRVFITFNIF